ncbi:MAG: hypothetical protein Q4C96_06480 [Planctomycetia bacterium]|nr:hypothetical protein [Planctomycetia bacterium]
MFGFLFASENARLRSVYDNKDVPTYVLPDPLMTPEGNRISSARQWTDTQRSVIYHLFETKMFGKLPESLQQAGNYPDFVTYELMEEDSDALNGTAIRRQVAIFFSPLQEEDPGDSILPTGELESSDSDSSDVTGISEDDILSDEPPAILTPDAASASVRQHAEIAFPRTAGVHAKESQTVIMLIYIPKNTQKPVPVFLVPNFHGNHTIHEDPGIFPHHAFDENGDVIPEDKILQKFPRGCMKSRWPVKKILDEGFALATFCYQDVQPDVKTASDHGIMGIYAKDFSSTDENNETSDFSQNPEISPPADSWGAISAWAWGLRRALDYMETDKIFDTSKVILMGHSRLGKTALWAGASDPRFAIIISNNSGCGGAAISRREFGETVSKINQTFPHWFCKNFHAYGTKVNDLPFDQHELIALIAPRPVYISSALEDLWADPYGEFLAAFHAADVYKLFGTDAFGNISDPSKLPPLNTSVGGKIGYHIRTGKHGVTDFDWTQFLRFAKKHFSSIPE